MQPPAPHWVPEFAAEASNGAKRPAGVVPSGCGMNGTWKRDPSPAIVFAVGEPEMARPASWLGALEAVQRA